jgi:hypothetical protein
MSVNCGFGRINPISKVRCQNSEQVDENKKQKRKSFDLITYKKRCRVPKKTALNMALFIISNAASFKKTNCIPKSLKFLFLKLFVHKTRTRRFKRIS